MINRYDVPDYPKFYIKAVGGRFSIEHRLTHSMVSSVETEEELKRELKRWNEMPDEELWEDLLYKRYASIVKGTEFEKRFSHEEEWYYSAWGMYTSRFYKENPDLLVTVEKIPHELINKMKQERNDEAQAIYKAGRERAEEYERRFKEREKIKDEIVPIGDTKKLEKVVAKKKLKKKVVFKKKKPNEVFSMPEVSDNPFD